MHTRKFTPKNYGNQLLSEERNSLNELLALLNKRWVPDVLFCIGEGNNRFSTLKEELQNISDNILAERLRLLEDYKLISKEIFNEVPSRVEYALTAYGQQLSKLLKQLCKFSDACFTGDMHFTRP